VIKQVVSQKSIKKGSKVSESINHTDEGFLVAEEDSTRDWARIGRLRA